MSFYSHLKLSVLINITLLFPIEIMQPFELFATAQESLMLWPVGTPEDPKAKIYVTPQQQAMFNLYYHLGLTQLWKNKAPSVELFPGQNIWFQIRPKW